MYAEIEFYALKETITHLDQIRTSMNRFYKSANGMVGNED